MRVLRAGFGLLLLLILGAVALQWPCRTRLVANRQPATQTLSFYAKGLAFLYRDSQYRLLAGEITRGLRADPEKVMAILQWTNQQVRHAPEGWPVVDDHILNIIIRGHGTDDQMADVFSTLCTYAGVPAFWLLFHSATSGKILVLSFVHLEGQWAVFDVANGRPFRDRSGRFASLPQLKKDPGLLTPAEELYHPGRSYADFFERMEPLEIPRILRAQRQMPWPRFWYETHRRVTGRGV